MLLPKESRKAILCSQRTDRGLLCKKITFRNVRNVGTNFGGWYVLEENYIMKNHVNVPTLQKVPTFLKFRNVTFYTTHPWLEKSAQESVQSLQCLIVLKTCWCFLLPDILCITQCQSTRQRMVTRSLNNKTIAIVASVVSVFHEEYPTSRSSRS